MENLFFTRRSIRKYKNKSIKEKDIDKIIQAALTSPSSKNSRPWELVVIKNTDTINKLSKVGGENTSFLKDAPLVIIVLANEDKSEPWVCDSSIIAHNIQLLAHFLGIGSCWNHIKDMVVNEANIEDMVKEIIRVPRDKKSLRVLTMISLGYPNEQLPAYSKKDLDYSLIHKEKF